jgi:hypothetical protein
VGSCGISVTDNVVIALSTGIHSALKSVLDFGSMKDRRWGLIGNGG